MVSAEQVLSDTEKREMDIRHLLRPVAEWFHDHEGELYERGAVVARIADDLSTDESHTTAEVNLAIGDIVGDGVDPIIQVETGDGKYVGVADYSQGPFWYGYTAYHTGVGRLHKVVCAECVTESKEEKDVYAPRWEPGEYDDDEMRGLMTAHHAARHADMDATAVVEEYTDGYSPDGNVTPADIAPHIDHEAYIASLDLGAVETGATLVSTTVTTAGDKFFHAGNDGDGSGLDADLIRGFSLDGGTTDEFLQSDGAGGVTFSVVNVGETALAFDFVGVP
jgi:hypothetical protein